MGDFNNWNKCEFPFTKLGFGKWELKLEPNSKGECRVPHMSRIKLIIKSKDGQIYDR